jgi:S1-C subfamily serine protease
MQAMMNFMMGSQGGKPEPAIIAPAALWGFEIQKAEKDEEAGVVVKDVLDGGPAALGGLKAGDRILTLDGRWTDTIGDTFTAASLVKPGRTVIVVVERDGKEVKLSIKPAKGA